MSIINCNVEAGRVYLTGATFNHKETIKSVNGGARWDKDRKAWHICASPRALDDLRDALASSVSLRFDDRCRELLSTAVAIRSAESIKTCDIDTLEKPVMKREPWPHQIRAFNFVKQQPSALLYMKMGTGKTYVSIAAITHSDDRLVLVLAPSHVVADDVWGKDVRKHALDDAAHPIVVTTLRGATKKRIAAIRHIVTRVMPAVPTSRHIIVTNHEAMSQAGFREAIESIAWDRIIIDEGHRIKQPGGVWARCAARLTAASKRRLILTGTPMDSRLDVYSQMRFLDPGLFGTRFAAFKARYAMLDRFGRPTQWVNTDEFESKVASISFYAGDDVVKLPPTQDIEIEFNLNADERRHYVAMKSVMISTMKGKNFSVSNAIGKLLRLRQITGGFLQDADVVERVGDSKAAALRGLIEDMADDEHVVVFACFHADLDIIKQSCGARRVFEISSRSKCSLDEWRATRGAVLVCQIDAASTGIDLTAARYAIYYSTTFSSITYAQSRKRNHRPGQERSVVYYHLIARGTVDRQVYKALATKAEDENDFIRAITEGVINDVYEIETEDES